MTHSIWIVRSTECSVTLKLVIVQNSKLILSPNDFRVLLYNEYDICLDHINRNFLIKRIKQSEPIVTINVITLHNGNEKDDCSYYGTSDQKLARTIYANEIVRVQTSICNN
jgi:hypothetical protein